MKKTMPLVLATAVIFYFIGFSTGPHIRSHAKTARKDHSNGVAAIAEKQFNMAVDKLNEAAKQIEKLESYVEYWKNEASLYQSDLKEYMDICLKHYSADELEVMIDE